MTTTDPFELVLEVNPDFVDKQPAFVVGARVLLVTPPIDENYWLLRVKVSGTQAVIGFPKFGSVGIGFAREEDWNTNLPYACDAEMIWAHIEHNKGDAAVPDERCLRAIRLIQDTVRNSRQGA